MNKKTTIAFEFFDSIENNSEYNFEKIVKSLIVPKNGDRSNYRRIKNQFIRYFDYLYGFKQTFPTFIEWVVKNKKMYIPNNTIFTFRDLEWMRESGLTWTEILMKEGVTKPIKWVYKDNQLVEIDYQINSDSNVGI